MKKTYLALSDEDKDYLKSLSKKRTIQAQVSVGLWLIFCQNKEPKLWITADVLLYIAWLNMIYFYH